MPKSRKKTSLLLGYSDSEHEDDSYDGSEDGDVSDECEIGESQNELNPNDTGKNDTPIQLNFEDVYGDRNLTILEFNQSLFGKNPEEITIPPPTRVQCSPELQAQIENLHEKVQNGYDLNKVIQMRKTLRNPSIYEKMILHCHIDEMATNFPKELYDPEPFLKPESYYEVLAKVQNEDMEKRDRERKEQQQQQQATKPPEKKSKWDCVNPTSGTSNNHSAAISAAIAAANKVKNQMAASQTTSTKPTVISAFGTISKKK